MRSLWGTYFLSRFSVKALRAHSARFVALRRGRPSAGRGVRFAGIKSLEYWDLSQQSARHGRPKAGRGAERAKRAERARSAFTENRLKKYVPHKDLTEKKNVSLNDFSDPHTRASQKKKYVPKILYPLLISPIQGQHRKKDMSHR